MAVKISNPITVPAATVTTPAASYDTIVVLRHKAVYSPATGKLNVSARVGLGACRPMAATRSILRARRKSASRTFSRMALPKSRPSPDSW